MNYQEGNAGFDTVDYQAQLAQLDEERVNCLAIIADSEAATRLAENPDFKKLVMQGYFMDEPSRLVGLFANGNLHSDARKAVERDLLAIGGFKNHMSQLIGMASEAQQHLVDIAEAHSGIMSGLSEVGD